MLKGIWSVAALALLVGCFSCDDGTDDETDTIDETDPPADFDGDGVPDLEDAFPSDPDESADSDEDGVGDNADAFPNDATETTDTDGDGVGDNADAFPDDPSQSEDTDGDGLADPLDPTPAGSTDNRLNSVLSGGKATVVEIDGLGGGDPHEGNLEFGCEIEWAPQGTLCDEPPTTHDPARSSKWMPDSGATWANSTGAVGFLVVDAGEVVDFNELRVFQMFSDGKLTNLRFSVHAETGATPPAADDPGWVLVTDYMPIGPGVSEGWSVANDVDVVSAPTVIDVPSQVTRYLLFEARNDGSQGDDGYIEFRSVKAFSVRRDR